MAVGRQLPLVAIEQKERPFLESDLDGDAYIKQAIGAHHRRDYNRLWRSSPGELAYRVARTPDDVRHAFERSDAGSEWLEKANAAPPWQSTGFMRGCLRAINNLAERDCMRVHTTLGSTDGLSPF